MTDLPTTNALKPWFFGLFAFITLLIGLLIASHGAEGPGYTLGLSIAAAALACIVYTVNAGFKKH